MKPEQTHLGRSADGTVRPAYETPRSVDPGLLVAVPRSDNREIHGINPSSFYGFDRWTCYEFSTLTRRGFPINGRVQIMYNCDTDVIVESKSLKLYLNSYNLDRMNVGPEILNLYIVNRIAEDLEAIGVTGADVSLVLNHDIASMPAVPLLTGNYLWLEKALSYETAHPRTPQQGVQTRVYPDRRIRLRANVRSNCKVTHQPDWGIMYIAFDAGGPFPDAESIYMMILEMREENHFHEEICEMMYSRLLEYDPKELLVACNYLRRGGIDINPVRATSEEMLESEIREPASCLISQDVNQ